jgi:hypothetical protein
MKGKLVKKNKEWFMEYLDGFTKVLMPLHPGELMIEGLWKLKNREIEFEVRKEYKGLRLIGDRENRNYVEIYQNYAKLKL